MINTPGRKGSQPAPSEPLNRLLYGKDLSEYANIPIEDLLNQLTEEELEELGNEVDPDDPHVPPSMRCKEQTKKSATGPLDRQKLLSYLKKYAMEQEDWPENKPFELGQKRGETMTLIASQLPFNRRLSTRQAVPDAWFHSHAPAARTIVRLS